MSPRRCLLVSDPVHPSVPEEQRRERGPDVHGARPVEAEQHLRELGLQRQQVGRAGAGLHVHGGHQLHEAVAAEAVD